MSGLQSYMQSHFRCRHGSEFAAATGVTEVEETCQYVNVTKDGTGLSK